MTEISQSSINQSPSSFPTMETQKEQFFRNFIANYVNQSIKAILMFLVAILIFLVFKRYFSNIILFIVSFVLSIFLSIIFARPLNKLNFIGLKVQEKYFAKLNKLTERKTWQKN